MHRRLYFFAHNLKDAESVFQQLLLARTGIRNIHFMARENIDLGNLPVVTVFQRYDVVHSMFVGLVIGGVIGIFAGIIGHGALNEPIGGVMLATTLIGAILGAWSASMIGMMVPNRQLKSFQKEIQNGQILLMVDVPFHKVKMTEETVLRGVPQVKFCGIDPTMPGFP